MRQCRQQSILLADLQFQAQLKRNIVATAEFDNCMLLLVHVQEERSDWRKGIPVVEAGDIRLKVTFSDDLCPVRRKRVIVPADKVKI